MYLLTYSLCHLLRLINDDDDDDVDDNNDDEICKVGNRRW